MRNSNKSFVMIHSTIIIIIIVALCFLKSYLLTADRLARIHFNTPPRVLLIGDSHAARGFDPKYIEGSVNLALDAESTVFSYYKIRKLIADNKSIRTVIIAASYHSLLGPDHYRKSEMMRRYHLLVDNEFYSEIHKDEGFVLSYVLKYVLDTYKLPFAISNDIDEYLYIRNKKDMFYNGSFEPSFESPILKRLSTVNTINFHYYEGGKIKNIASAKLHYLYKIHELCSANNIELYLVNLPVSKLYFESIPDEIKRKTDSIYNSMTDDNTHIINLTDNGFGNSYFRDPDHLNVKGSTLISKQINQIMLSNINHLPALPSK